MNNIMIINLKQRILDRLVRSKRNSVREKLVFKFLSLLKDKLFSKDETFVKYNFYGKDIVLPFSHDLPVNKSLFPLYSDNIGRIALYLKQKYDNLKVIDIGANIGDTAFIIKSKTDIPILCIEGDKKYFSLLEKNISYLNNVYAENCFIGVETGKKEYVYYKGSGKIVESNTSNNKISFSSLSSVINKNQLFSDSKFIKIDTDGFDCSIIRSEIEFIKKHKPVIFFEYDPYFLSNIDDDGVSVFNTLYKAGYSKMIIYENTGEYLLSVELNQEQIIEDIHMFYSSRKGEKYCDICVFHKEDDDIWSLIRGKELEFFSENKN